MSYINLWDFSAIFIKKPRFLLYIMVSGKHKSRSMRKVFTRIPSGKAKVSYKKRKPSAAKCATCGKVLSGTPRERPFRMKKMPKTAKRPQRPFGGVLCSACTRKKIIAKARE